MVVAAGTTTTEEEDACGVALISLSCTDVAPLTSHASVVVCPAVMAAGLAPKLVMTGTDAREGAEEPLPPQPLSRSVRSSATPARNSPRRLETIAFSDASDMPVFPKAAPGSYPSGLEKFKIESLYHGET